MIIDTHSHIGKDYYFGESNLLNYDDYCYKCGINVGFLMPMPWPVHEEKDVFCSLLWEHENYKLINYYKEVKKNNIKVREKIYLNPYEKINNYYNKLIKETNTKTKIFFIPLIHGVLDKPDYVENIIKKTGGIAVKFHGFASGFFADDVNPDIIEIIKYYDVPIIIHTSVYNYNDGYGVDTKYWRNKCNPYSWTKFLLDNNLKGVLNHGACLDKETIKLVNEKEGIMIGIGPDLDISLDPYKVNFSKDEFIKKGYLNILKNLVSPDKLLFDVDYNWNKKTEDSLDFDSIKRIRNVWNEDDADKILSKNAIRFYKKII